MHAPSVAYVFSSEKQDIAYFLHKEARRARWKPPRPIVFELLSGSILLAAKVRVIHDLAQTISAHLVNLLNISIPVVQRLFASHEGSAHRIDVVVDVPHVPGLVLVPHA